MGKPRSERTQREKFEEAARESGADESEEAFDVKLKRIAKAPAPAKGSKKEPPAK